MKTITKWKKKYIKLSKKIVAESRNLIKVLLKLNIFVKSRKLN